MEILSSSSTYHPQFSIVSSNSKIDHKVSKTNIKNNYFFTISQPMKWLITTYTQNLNHSKQPNNYNQTMNKKPLPEIIFQALDELITTFLDRPLRPELDPKQVLAGNFAPVDELHPIPCHVAVGSLPSCLHGAYIRNGPNPQFVPRGPYHLFDGDGMLHAIKISNGEATFCSRYIKTYKYEVERKMGYPIFRSIFSSLNNGLMASMARCLLSVVQVLFGQYSPIVYGFGQVNTSLAMFCGKLFALCESDLPYAIKFTSDGDIITLGRHKLKNERFLNMNAHPKIDPRTGEVFGFSSNMLPPFLTYFRILSDGCEQKDMPIVSMEHASMVHDFAITKSYAVFPDTQIVIDALEIMRGRSPVGIDPGKMPRLGVIPRYASDELEMRWIDVPGLNMLHVVNAWEEGDDDSIVIIATNMLSVEHAFDRINLIHSSLEIITIDAKAMKVVTRCPISAKNLDFGTINPQYAGKQNRYVYAAVCDPAPKVASVVKIDLSLSGPDLVVASRLYGPGCFGGEPIFVPRVAENRDGGDEDDGYLITYLHDENSEKSKFIVMDAKSPNLEIVADVLLPGRVPYGFHGIFVKENELNNLK